VASASPFERLEVPPDAHSKEKLVVTVLWTFYQRVASGIHKNMQTYLLIQNPGVVGLMSNGQVIIVSGGFALKRKKMEGI